MSSHAGESEWIYGSWPAAAQTSPSEMLLVRSSEEQNGRTPAGTRSAAIFKPSHPQPIVWVLPTRSLSASCLVFLMTRTGNSVCSCMMQEQEDEQTFSQSLPHKAARFLSFSWLEQSFSSGSTSFRDWINWKHFPGNWGYVSLRETSPWKHLHPSVVHISP